MARIAHDPADFPICATSSAPVLGRFALRAGSGAGIRENLREIFAPGLRGAVRSRFLVEWESRAANFARNLRDVIVSPFAPHPGHRTDLSAVPELWSKRTLLKRVQSLSLSYHVVLLAFIVAPFLPELLTPSVTQAKNGPWVPTRLVNPYIRLAGTSSRAPHGGGSGGERNPLPATTGRLPIFSHLQLAPPSARREENARLAVDPTLIGPPELHLKSSDMPNWGDPVSSITNGSSGPGYEGGIGDGPGGGIGNGGKGPGYGPGGNGGTGGDVYNAGAEGVGYPICVYCPNPPFSEEAVKSKYQGIVLLLVTITADGRVTNIHILKSLGSGLDDKAVEAVRSWKFKPALGRDHQPVTVNAPVEITFRLY